MGLLANHAPRTENATTGTAATLTLSSGSPAQGSVFHFQIISSDSKFDSGDLTLLPQSGTPSAAAATATADANPDSVSTSADPGATASAAPSGDAPAGGLTPGAQIGVGVGVGVGGALVVGVLAAAVLLRRRKKRRTGDGVGIEYGPVGSEGILRQKGDAGS